MVSPAIRNYALVFFGALAFHLAGTWSLPLIDRDEPRFAEASREMKARADYVVPYFNSGYRFDKPPLTYWAQVASYDLFGENDFAARFPTAIAAALTALVLFSWGKRMGNETTGWWAAVIFTVCLQVFLHGKAAVADMWLVLFVTLAHRAGWEFKGLDESKPGSQNRNILCYYFWLALAFLAKGPIGWTPLLTVAFTRGEPARRRSFIHLAGIVLMLGLVCAWGTPALLRTNGEFWKIGIGKHVLARSVASMEGHGASSPLIYVALLPFYFVSVFASFFPWSLNLLPLIKRLRAQADRTDRYLVVGALIIFLIFSLVKTKLPHYTLPAFPLLALLLARHARALQLSRTWAIATAATLFLVALVAPPLVARKFPAYDLARQSATALRPEMKFAAVDFNEPSLVWYFRRYLNDFLTTPKRKEAAAFMAEEGPRLLVLPSNVAEQIFPQPDPAWSQFHTHGFNIPKGQGVELTLLLKPQ